VQTELIVDSKYASHDKVGHPYELGSSGGTGICVGFGLAVSLALKSMNCYNAFSV
jgi:hypothetical protein